MQVVWFGWNGTEEWRSHSQSPLLHLYEYACIVQLDGSVCTETAYMRFDILHMNERRREREGMNR